MTSRALIDPMTYQVVAPGFRSRWMRREAGIETARRMVATAKRNGWRIAVRLYYRDGTPVSFD